jgi:hypothetical protein
MTSRRLFVLDLLCFYLLSLEGVERKVAGFIVALGLTFQASYYTLNLN